MDKLKKQDSWDIFDWNKKFPQLSLLTSEQINTFQTLHKRVEDHKSKTGEGAFIHFAETKESALAHQYYDLYEKAIGKKVTVINTAHESFYND